MCSVLERECEAVVAAVADVLSPVEFDAPVLDAVAGGRTSFRLLRRTHGTDGFFVASFVRAVGGGD